MDLIAGYYWKFKRGAQGQMPETEAMMEVELPGLPEASGYAGAEGGLDG